MRRKIKHSVTLTLWHFRSIDAQISEKCQSAIMPHSNPCHQDRYGSPPETRSLFFPFIGKEGGPLNATDKSSTFSLGRSRSVMPPLSPPDFGQQTIPSGQNRQADFIRSEFGFRVAPKHHSTPPGALVQTRFQRGGCSQVRTHFPRESRTAERHGTHGIAARIFSLFHPIKHNRK